MHIAYGWIANKNSSTVAVCVMIFPLQKYSDTNIRKDVLFIYCMQSLSPIIQYDILLFTLNLNSCNETTAGENTFL